jgi:hypothetical protein
MSLQSPSAMTHLTYIESLGPADSRTTKKPCQNQVLSIIPVRGTFVHCDHFDNSNADTHGTS